MAPLNAPSGTGRPEPPVIDPPGIDGPKAHTVSIFGVGSATTPVITPLGAGEAEAVAQVVG